ncbi:MAG TPA: exosortase/archaeosortase family protein [Candidatus Limnocylindrales bacterium]|nr:exosortase/archaeosortase family protein [Candidatus Limnocylindrales bacterium]
MNATISSGRPGASVSKAHLAYGILVSASILICLKRLTALTAYALGHDSSSQILLIPFVAAYLIWLARKRVFTVIDPSPLPGAAVMLTGGLLFWLAGSASWPLPGNENLCLSAFAMFLIWVGAFVLCYGLAATRAAVFPLLFLLLMIPLPDPVLDWVTFLLQRGSTEITYLIFKAVGVPVFRQGFFLTVPGITIEVAKECSSIRSSIALVITCLIAAHFYLRTWWKALLFVLISLPLSVVKNGIRIATLTLLSLYVDPGFLHGDLHRDGGFVFFFLALLMLWPVLVGLERSDRQHTLHTVAHT